MIKKGRSTSPMRFIAGLIPVVFIVTSLLSLIMMHADTNMKMGLGMTPAGACGMAMAVNAPCFMTINEHIELWQKMFTVTLINPIFLLLTVIFMAIFVRRRLGYVFVNVSQTKIRHRYLSKNPTDKIFSYLEQLFASGILHTRIYA